MRNEFVWKLRIAAIFNYLFVLRTFTKREKSGELRCLTAALRFVRPVFCLADGRWLNAANALKYFFCLIHDLTMELCELFV